MKNYTVELNIAKKFNTSVLVEIATVKTTSRKKAIEAVRFYLKTGLEPIDAEVTPTRNLNGISFNCHFSAYVKTF